MLEKELLDVIIRRIFFIFFGWRLLGGFVLVFSNLISTFEVSNAFHMQFSLLFYIL